MIINILKQFKITTFKFASQVYKVAWPIVHQSHTPLSINWNNHLFGWLNIDCSDGQILCSIRVYLTFSQVCRGATHREGRSRGKFHALMRSSWSENSPSTMVLRMMMFLRMIPKISRIYIEHIWGCNFRWSRHSWVQWWMGVGGDKKENGGMHVTMAGWLCKRVGWLKR